MSSSDALKFEETLKQIEKKCEDFEVIITRLIEEKEMSKIKRAKENVVNDDSNVAVLSTSNSGGLSKKVYQRIRRSTMFERRRRGQLQENPEPLALSPLPDPELETQNEIGQVSETIDDEETYPYPGGPEDNSLLSSYKLHVARFLWRGKERPILRTLCHTTKLLGWKIGGEFSSDYFKQLLMSTGLWMVPPMSYARCNKNLIAAFVERWHPETNTFHLPFGEMTITLDDVLCLTGLPIEGRSVRTMRKERRDVIAQLRALFGVSEAEIADTRAIVRGLSVRLEWLHTTFEETLVSDDRDKLTRGCRAYLLYMFGCTLFTDKSGNCVLTKWLEYLDDVESVNKYAWGAATLAYLYRQLGAASRFGVKQIGGYLTLLEAWICERFPSLRSTSNVNYKAGQPLAYRWSIERPVGPSLSRLQSYRETLDLMTSDQVIWCPYDEDVRTHFPLSPVTYYHGCISAHDVLEPYNPDRVLRQFGYIQTIPNDPVYAGDIPRGDSRTRVLLSSLASLFDRWPAHVLPDETFIRRAVPPWECVPTYMAWYLRSSHPIIQNPEKRSLGSWRSTTTTTTDPWKMIMTARNLLRSDIDRWEAGERDFDLSLLMPRMTEAYHALDINGPTEDEHCRGRGRRH
ncbi:hypothetical protein CASFOL_036778 [Castilleja foliolosa]|uniref:Aminotransferase-like plant mobile domain-containing protein n=1 Tax=Castilleja foliolosa TaxID=1961234 RepID=A0ABD3BP07_9LAMI